MCKPDNQTIYQECREKLRNQGCLTNQDMRVVIKSHGGCLDDRAGKAFRLSPPCAYKVKGLPGA